MHFNTKKFILTALFSGLIIFTQPNGVFSQPTDINAKDETGLTALMIASQDGTDAEIKKFLKKGADPEIKDQYGWTALMYAAASNVSIYPKTEPAVSRVKALLEASANPNVSDARGWTPLIIAAIGGKTDFVKILLAKGADVNAKDKNGATALSYAQGQKHNDVVKLLEKAGGAGIEIDKTKIPERIGPIDVLPKRILTPESRARYTDLARMNQISGIVRFRILVATDGTIKRAKLVSGLPYGLTEEAIEAVKRAKIEPGSHEGKPVEYWLPVQYTFTIY